MKRDCHKHRITMKLMSYFQWMCCTFHASAFLVPLNIVKQSSSCSSLHVEGISRSPSESMSTSTSSDVDNKLQLPIIPTLYNSLPNGFPDSQYEQWLKYCDDVDEILEGLVSPAPESFHVIHRAFEEINRRLVLDERVYFFEFPQFTNDLRALSSYLVKSEYALALSLHDSFRWKLVKRVEGGSCIIFPIGYHDVDDNDEMYHKHTTLQLSQMALELATSSQDDPDLLSKVHGIADQAEVSSFKQLSVDSCLKHTTLITHKYIALYNYASSEKADVNTWLGFEGTNFFGCMLQLCFVWSTEFKLLISDARIHRYS